MVERDGKVGFFILYGAIEQEKICHERAKQKKHNKNLQF
jgi:hypothetical protein